jgi:hypothetical protein
MFAKFHECSCLLTQLLDTVRAETNIVNEIPQASDRRWSRMKTASKQACAQRKSVLDLFIAFHHSV